ncbi:MAG TPA: ATP synthase F1 subunit gamma [Candidatus Dormibacteraeota bacterium]|nr:ATP synthase F1 subunit gamma [Candidatus Dormibacteraeota bacterium]
MPSLRDVRRRIRSVQNTQKITKAMQVVSATKMRRAQQAVQATRPYAEKMVEVLQTTSQLAREYRHPYLERREGDRALIIVITTDKGLCGALNANLLRAVNRYAMERHRGHVRYVTIGRKGRDLLVRLGREIVAEVSNLRDRPGVGVVLPAIRAALDEYDEGRVDVILLAYTRWVSTLRQEPLIRPLVPIEIPAGEGRQAGGDYLYEPEPEAVLDELLPRYVEAQVYQAVLENQASEHSARMIAMQNATNAAGDMIRSLTLTANKVRQATITTELMEIVSGAEALRGSAG